jgi:hypothetical protein
LHPVNLIVPARLTEAAVLVSHNHHNFAPGRRSTESRAAGLQPGRNCFGTQAAGRPILDNPVVDSRLWAADSPSACGLWRSPLPLISVVFLIRRSTNLEDRYLRKHLEGDVGYTQRVRYRLLPGVL